MVLVGSDRQPGFEEALGRYSFTCCEVWVEAGPQGLTSTVRARATLISATPCSVADGTIDGLGSRIYVSLAAPWFFRTAQQRAGLSIGLRPAPPRPTEPPRG